MLGENNDQMQTILRVLVGSQAHGLATAESDQDFRRVYVMPTENMFHLGFKYPGHSVDESRRRRNRLGR